MKTNHKTAQESAALDALTKISSLLNAAQWLTSTEEESSLMLELVGAAEDVATRTLKEQK
ncbi:hypothetical protein [Klebsiella aerogenes]|uniref:hypothetical protein n=1 Tax=Klebsiella aerogenes TaxID=548 RepID=UPI000F7F2035|nr:hypothetical protein [Klebsiella aerogenes]RSV89330.1 hypothetical protein EGH57_09975 [Klebsiella aerogenes]